MNTSDPKFKRMMSLFTKLDKQGRRHAYAWEESNGRTESTKELTDSEVDKIITKLDLELKEKDACDVMRKKLIHMARDMGWEVYDKVKKKVVADMQRIENWVVKYSPYHKKLNDHNEKELPLLITQFENYYNWFLSSL